MSRPVVYFAVTNHGFGHAVRSASVVANIIEKHYSQINLISEVGIGTTFWFDLDLYQGSIASKKINDVSL